MITIKPFRGLRPANGLAQEIVSPPYDVLDSAEARELAGKQKYSFLHVVKPEIDLPKELDTHAARVYAKGLENLKSYMIRNLLIQDEKPCLYICPVQNYVIVDDKLVFSWQGCVECGACRIACPHDAIEWEYPRGGFGVCFRYG